MWGWVIVALIIGIVIGLRNEHLDFKRIVDGVEKDGKHILTIGSNIYEVKKLNMKP
jgi:hypothetical protein